MVAVNPVEDDAEVLVADIDRDGNVQSHGTSYEDLGSADHSLQPKSCEEISACCRSQKENYIVCGVVSQDPIFWNSPFPIGASPVSGNLAKRVPATRLAVRAQSFSLPAERAGFERPGPDLEDEPHLG